MKKLYVINADGTNLFKIGISDRPEKRIKELQTGSAYNLSIIFVIDTKYASTLEKTLHRIYSLNKKIDEDQSAFGEWFHLDPDVSSGLENKCIEIIKNFEMLESFGNSL